MIPDDDPVPYRVMVGLARREGLIESDYPVDDEGLPAGTYNAVLTLIERDGYESGRETVGSERDETAGEAAVEEPDNEQERALNAMIDELGR